MCVSAAYLPCSASAPRLNPLSLDEMNEHCRRLTSQAGAHRPPIAPQNRFGPAVALRLPPSARPTQPSPRPSARPACDNATRRCGTPSVRRRAGLSRAAFQCATPNSRRLRGIGSLLHDQNCVWLVRENMGWTLGLTPVQFALAATSLRLPLRAGT